MGSNPTPAFTLPRSVVIGIDPDGAEVSMLVCQQVLYGGALGYLDRRNREIVIHANQPEIGKHLILLHELIHAVAENMRAQGLCSRQPSESFVGNLAGGLFGVLSASGMLVDVDLLEALKFMREADGK